MEGKGEERKGRGGRESRSPNFEKLPTRLGKGEDARGLAPLSEILNTPLRNWLTGEDVDVFICKCNLSIFRRLVTATMVK